MRQLLIAFALVSHLCFAGAGFNEDAFDVQTVKLKRNSSFYLMMKEAGISSKDIGQIVAKSKKWMNLSKLRPQSKFEILRSRAPVSAVTELRYRLKPDQVLFFRKLPKGQWRTGVINLDSRVQTLSFTGRVESSLWESAMYAGMDPELIGNLAAIFAWQIDFAREVQKGDQWRILVEQKLIDNEVIGWGEILAAEYINQGRHFSGFILRPEYGEAGEGYFTVEGESLRRMFLKAPLKFGRISSRFNLNRFHPILKKHRPHLGVDYAAPRGTPIMAVGDGVVTRVANLRGGGKTIKIRHNSIYRTHYMHMSRFAKGMKRGARVKQGQVIGYVGSTGLSTGPHLHFELWENGKYVDPLGKKFPSADPVPGELLSQFQRQAKILNQLLPSWVNEADEAPRGPLYVRIESL